MKSKRPAPTSGSRLRAQNSRILGSRPLMFRGVKTRARRRRCTWWRGRVLEDDGAGRQLHAALDQLEHGALARDVGLPVQRAAVDVLEAADGVEVVALVVVERPFVAEPLPHRIRVRVDLEVVGVVVDVGFHHGHVSPDLRWSSFAPRPPGEPGPAVAAFRTGVRERSWILPASRPAAGRRAIRALHKSKKCILVAYAPASRGGRAPDPAGRGAGGSIAETLLS